ncbi:MAG: PilZ domain-containing protein [Candidatus Sulfotelmatobacter sp.]
MSDENSAGAAYLAALKQSAPSSAGMAPAHAPIPSSRLQIAPAAVTGTETSGSEKRKSPRYRCQGSARLREIASNVTTWATFTDISLHGCYVEAMSTFRMGVKLGLMIEVNGFRVEANGEVRVVYPNLGMGICFTSMSDSNREQLRALLSSLSRPSVILGVRRDGNTAMAPEPNALSPITNPGAALREVLNFFDARHILSREEFFHLLRKSQTESK